MSYRAPIMLLCGLLPFAGQVFALDSLIKPAQVAVVVNIDETSSVEVGQYYLKARGIPESNLVRVSLPDAPRRLSPERFEQLKRQIEAALKPGIEVIVLTWTKPYAVACNSITSAMTLGFDAEQCKQTCAPSRANPYFDSQARRPSDVGLKLAILLPADSPELAEAVIDRGRLSGFRLPDAGAYFLTTADRNRNSRSRFFPKTGAIPFKRLAIYNLRQDYIENHRDVMIYETGLVSVPKLDTLGFMPGALADHLTSSGGDLLGNGQMSSLKWLEAGATASYGTVSEPCNYWQKFPNPAVLLKHYVSGETAVEAYWKSVAWPAQGLIIGEPLAAPYCTTCAGRDEPFSAIGEPAAGFK